MGNIIRNEDAFAEVLLPVAIPKLLTYRISGIDLMGLPESVVGCRMAVPFQKNKIVTGIILNLHTDSPKYEVKSAIKILEKIPSFNSSQIKFLKWLSNYYMCELGLVLKAAMPTALSVDSTTLISLNNDAEAVQSLLQEELYIINYIKEHKKTLPIMEDNPKAGLDSRPPDTLHIDCVSLTDLYLLKIPNSNKKVSKIIDDMLTSKVLVSHEKIQEKYMPKLAKIVYLSEVYFQKDSLSVLFSDLEKNPKQLNILLEYFKHTSIDRTDNRDIKVLKSYFNKDYLSTSALNTLIKKRIFIEEECEVSRLEVDVRVKSSLSLTEVQQKALEEIYIYFNNDKITLLHGVTGSGKTEIYVSMIEEVLHAGGEVLMLMPEIALTTHMVMRLRQIFGNTMNVFHSRYSNNERAEVWNNVKYGKVNFIIGTRSAIFLPFSKLSLIIIDEEHDLSYKQTDPAPRYNARDAAIVLAKLHNAKVLLGSATPSIETYYNTKKGKYALVTLSERFNNIPLPKFDILGLKKDEGVEGTEFSKDFLEIISQTIAPENNDRRQVLIFQNRRGYAPYIMCEECLWIPYCKQCDVSLTYHQQLKALRCHYCGNKSNIVHKCLLCGSSKLKNMGFGTEKLEETLSSLFPGANIARLDLDTARNTAKYVNILENIKNFTTNIIVGTQMISKGFDFDNIGLVGIMDIDRLMRIPNFRAKERTFQLAVQVGGRCGRKGKQGRVIIQTYNKKEPLLKFISNNEYEKMYDKEILERKTFFYPPFSRLIKVTFKHKSVAISKNASMFFNKVLKVRIDTLNNTSVKGEIIKILGPEAPIVSKIKNLSLIDIWLKFNCYELRDKIKSILKDAASLLHKQHDFKQVQVSFDVDPV